MNPVARIIILRLFSRKELVKVQGVIFTPAMLGYVLGPFIGGVICDSMSWHWIFFINLPVGIMAFVIGLIYVHQHVTENVRHFDIVGFLIAGSALVTITFGVEMIGHDDLVGKVIVYGSIILGAMLFAVLIVYCLKKINPVLDLIIFKIRTFRVSVVINSCFFALNAGVALLLPLMYQESFGLDAATSGLLTLPIAVGYLVFRGFANNIITRFGFKKVLQINLVLSIVWLIGIANIGSQSSAVYIVVVEFLYGASTIFIGSAAGALTYMELSAEQSGNATSIDLTLRQFAASLGVALTALILSGLTQTMGLSLFDSGAQVYHYSFYALVLLLLLGLLLSLTLSKTDGMQEVAPAAVK